MYAFTQTWLDLSERSNGSVPKCTVHLKKKVLDNLINYTFVDTFLL